MTLQNQKKYLIPDNLEQALEMAQLYSGSFSFLAGGTDVMVNRQQGNHSQPVLIDLSKINNLNQVYIKDDYLIIGALVTLHDIAKNKLINEYVPALAEAAYSVGSPLIRQTATLGGNILCENRCLYFNQSEWWRESVGYCLKCNGDICIATGGKNACFSEYVSDTGPALIAYNAMISIQSSEGIRITPLENIYTGDGVKPRNIEEKEIITEIKIPLKPKTKASFLKLRQRQSLDFTSLSIAVSKDMNGKIRACAAGVDPKPVLVVMDAESSANEIAAKLYKLARTVDNDMFSRGYRKQMIHQFVDDCLNQLK